MTGSFNNFLSHEHDTAVCAMRTGSQTGFGAGRSNSCIFNSVVTGSRSGFVVLFRTAESTFGPYITCFGAGCGQFLNDYVIVCISIDGGFVVLFRTADRAFGPNVTGFNAGRSQFLYNHVIVIAGRFFDTAAAADTVIEVVVFGLGQDFFGYNSIAVLADYLGNAFFSAVCFNDIETGVFVLACSREGRLFTAVYTVAVFIGVLAGSGNVFNNELTTGINNFLNAVFGAGSFLLNGYKQNGAIAGLRLEAAFVSRFNGGGRERRLFTAVYAVAIFIDMLTGSGNVFNNELAAGVNNFFYAVFGAGSFLLNGYKQNGTVAGLRLETTFVSRFGDIIGIFSTANGADAVFIGMFAGSGEQFNNELAAGVNGFLLTVVDAVGFVSYDFHQDGAIAGFRLETAFVSRFNGSGRERRLFTAVYAVAIFIDMFACRGNISMKTLTAGCAFCQNHAVGTTGSRQFINNLSILMLAGCRYSETCSHYSRHQTDNHHDGQYQSQNLILRHVLLSSIKFKYNIQHRYVSRIQIYRCCFPESCTLRRPDIK